MNEKILNFYGNDFQIIKAMEEMGELIVELAKTANYEGRHDKIVEEIADVENTLDTIKLMLTCQNEVENIKKIKLERELRKINELTGLKYEDDF